MFTKVTVLVVITLVAMTAGIAQAGLLFSDNFDTGAGSWDVNSEYDLGRQTGLLAPLSYVEKTETTSIGTADWKTRVNDTASADPAGSLVLAANGGTPDWIWVSPNHNFMESSSFTISFDIKPCFYTSDGDLQQWGGVIFGTNTVGAYAWATDGVSLAMRGNGDFHWWNGSASSGEVDTASTDGDYHIDIVVDSPGFGSDANVKIFVDGTECLDFTRIGGFTANRITLIGESYTISSHAIDNFAVTTNTIAAPTFTPEPGTYADAQDVTISTAEPDATIRFTTDGTEPSLTNGQDYTTPIHIAGDTTFKAKTFKGSLESATVTAVYVVGAVELFTDNFTASSSECVGNQLEEGRQGGLVGPLVYDELAATAIIPPYTSETQVSHPTAPGALYLHPGSMPPDPALGIDYVWVSPQHNFTDSGDFEISFDVTPLAPGSNPAADPNYWGALVFGTSAPGSFPVFTNGVGIIFRGTGALHTWDAGVTVGEGDVTYPQHSGYYQVRVVVTTADFNGSSADVRVYVDNNLVQEFTRSGGFTANRIALGSCAEMDKQIETLFDNFKIKTKASSTLAPVFTPDPGTYSGSVNVKITCADAASTIRYTTDGSEPSLFNGQDYTGQVTLSVATPLKAKAFKEGGESVTTNGTYTMVGADMFRDSFDASANSPDINFEYAAGRQFGLLSPLMYDELPDTASGAYDSETQISHPDAPGALYLHPASLLSSLGIDYVWVSPQHNFTESSNFEISFDLNPVGPGSNTDPAYWGSLIFGSTSTGALPKWFPATDGTGIIFRGTGELLTFDNGTNKGAASYTRHSGYYHIRVVVAAADFNGSPANVKIYVDNILVQEFTRDAGYFANRISLCSSAEVNRPVVGIFDNFKLAVNGLPIPNFSPGTGLYGGSVSVTIPIPVPGSTVRYTTDGSEPTASNGIDYTGPITISSDTTLKARAFCAGWTDSAVGTATYSFVPTYTVSQTKQHADGEQVICGDGIVTAVFGENFYVEDETRTVGIKAHKASHGVVVGDKVNVGGVMATGSDHERFIEAANVNKTGTGSIEPLGVVNKAVGGGDFEYNATTGAGQKGVAGGSGLNNIGLLVKVWGRVTSKSGSRFTLTDGSGFDLAVAVPSDTAAPEEGYYTVVGISSCEDADGSASSVIKVRNQEDLKTSPMGTILFSDNFSTSPGGSLDVNFEYAAGRQSGSVAPLSYSESIDSSMFRDSLTTVNYDPYPGKLLISGGGGIAEDNIWVSPNHSFTESGKFEIWFDANPVIAGTNLQDAYWVGVSFGSPMQGDALWYVNGFGMIMRRSGGIHYWDNDGTATVSSGEVQGVSHPGVPYQVRITVDTPDFTGSQPAIINVYVDGVKLLTYSRPTGFMSNFITLCTYEYPGATHYHTVDNFMVLIPE